MALPASGGAWEGLGRGWLLAAAGMAVDSPFPSLALSDADSHLPGAHTHGARQRAGAAGCHYRAGQLHCGAPAALAAHCGRSVGAGLLWGASSGGWPSSAWGALHACRVGCRGLAWRPAAGGPTATDRRAVPCAVCLPLQRTLDISDAQLAELRVAYEAYLRRMARLITNRNQAYAEVAQVRGPCPLIRAAIRSGEKGYDEAEKSGQVCLRVKQRSMPMLCLAAAPAGRCPVHRAAATGAGAGRRAPLRRPFPDQPGQALF